MSQCDIYIFNVLGLTLLILISVHNISNKYYFNFVEAPLGIRFAHSFSFKGSNKHDSEMSKNKYHSIYPTSKSQYIPRNGFSACILLKDENHRISEWLAYHWLTLPLKYVVVAIDPTSATSPESILRLWNSLNMGLEIVIWKDTDFGHWIDDKMDELHKHRDRQKRLICECLKYHQAKNRTWVAIIDPDEFITYNIIGDNDPGISQEKFDEAPVQFNNSTYRMLMKKKRESLKSILQQDKTIFDFIEEGRGNEPWESEPCYLMPRLMFSSVESTFEEARQTNLEDFGFDISTFNTLRYFHHAKKGSFDYNYYGKVIIDVSRINRKEITRYMHSIHRPLEYTCMVPLKEYDVGILRVHHYLGSWKEYSSRSDIRRNKEKFFRKSTVDGGTDYQLQQWLKKFILKVGVSKSKMLLESAGVINYGKFPIIHSDSYTFLNDSYFDHDA